MSTTAHKEFAENVINQIRDDPDIAGLAIGGSWISDEIDEFSDLDFILVSFEKIFPDKEKMFEYTRKFGNLLSAFTGEHVGEPRLIIGLYDNPLLHIDIKFLSLEEFWIRIEDPVILYEKDNMLSNIISSTKSAWPRPDFQWIEDRFWVWIHYGATKLGRGEYLEAIEFLSFLRMTVLSPLLKMKNGIKPNGVRKVEKKLKGKDLEDLKSTVAQYHPESIFYAVNNAIRIYRELREHLYGSEIILKVEAELRSIEYLKDIESRNKKQR